MWQAEADKELTLSASPTTAVGQKALALAKRRYSTVVTRWKAQKIIKFQNSGIYLEKAGKGMERASLCCYGPSISLFQSGPCGALLARMTPSTPGRMTPTRIIQHTPTSQAYFVKDDKFGALFIPQTHSGVAPCL